MHGNHGEVVRVTIGEKTTIMVDCSHTQVAVAVAILVRMCVQCVQAQHEGVHGLRQMEKMSSLSRPSTED